MPCVGKRSLGLPQSIESPGRWPAAAAAWNMLASAIEKSISIPVISVSQNDRASVKAGAVAGASGNPNMSVGDANVKEPMFC